MTKYRRGHDRDELLADVAEMYYGEGFTQAEISHQIGMTRSAISRMLSEARQKGIVEISVHRPLRFDKDLETDLVERFNLKNAKVLLWQNKDGQYDRLRFRLGRVAAQVLRGLLKPGMVLGVAWGTTVNATIEALEVSEPAAMDVVQLVGVLGSSSHAFNAQALVEMLARKVGGEGTYLYSPFIVENADTARSILNIPNVRDAIALGRKCDVALLGIGTVTDSNYCSLFLGGHISRRVLKDLVDAGAVGDVSGRHFDIYGDEAKIDFHDRLVGIARKDLLAIPTRLGVAGNVAKAQAILGALRGGYVNILVTDSGTAEELLVLDDASARIKV
jgi:DNA-binding transcriptional regulator LsrR (DeoR family)